jgi:hypothetical protein
VSCDVEAATVRDYLSILPAVPSAHVGCVPAPWYAGLVVLAISQLKIRISNLRASSNAKSNR